MRKRALASEKKMSKYWTLIKSTFTEFGKNDIFTQAAALAYYTIFSLPPVLLVILYTTTLFYDEQEVRSIIFNEIGDLVGQASANQLNTTVSQIGLFDQNWWASIVGVGTLLFTATTVFVTIQNALNKIFKVKPKPKGLGILKMLKDRLLSFAFLLGIAFVLLVSLSVDAFISAFGNYLSEKLPDISMVIVTLASIVLPFIMTVFLFTMIFKYLPDIKIEWKDTLVGATITAVLFSIGKELIGYYIGNSNVANLYDTAGSIMVIMIWVFYASVIFLFGAVFVYVYGDKIASGIEPSDYAVEVIHKEIEMKEENNY